VRWAFLNRKPVRVADVRTDPIWHDLYLPVADGAVSELDVPLVSGEAVLGVINFVGTQVGQFTEADERFLVALAGQAVLAIQNAQAYEQARRDADDRQAINAVSRAMIGQLDLAHVFDQILVQALRVTNSDFGTLHLYDPEQHDLELVAERGVLPAQRNRRIKVGEGIIGPVAEERILLNVPDVTKPPWSERHIPDIPDIRAELAAPLLEGDQLRGVINIEHQNAGHFDERAERLLLALADLAVIAIQNARENALRLDAEQRVREAEVMSTIGQATMELTHRLGNDLGPIVPAVNAIRDEIARLGITSPMIEKHLDRIISDKTRITDLAKGLRDELADINQGLSKSPDRDIIVVRDLLEETARARPDLPSLVEVSIEETQGIARVVGSYKEITNILRNLFVNAVDAMPKGGKITMRARNADTPIDLSRLTSVIRG
jgi:GAF domain-containing protein